MENLLKYWCFTCLKHFETQRETACCSLCQSEAVQLTDNNNNDPSQFAVYQIPTQNQQQQQVQAQPQQNQSQDDTYYAFFTIREFQIPFDSQPIVRRQIRIIHFIDPNQNLNPLEQIFGQGGLINLLNSLRGQTNLVPASQQEKDSLQQVDKVNECAVCQQEENGQERKGYKLNCGHNFHIDCLDPWLQRTNTCPTCRAHI